MARIGFANTSRPRYSRARWGIRQRADDHGNLGPDSVDHRRDRNASEAKECVQRRKGDVSEARSGRKDGRKRLHGTGPCQIWQTAEPCSVVSVTWAVLNAIKIAKNANDITSTLRPYGSLPSLASMGYVEARRAIRFEEVE